MGCLEHSGETPKKPKKAEHFQEIPGIINDNNTLWSGKDVMTFVRENRRDRIMTLSPSKSSSAS